jgi:hypothetical protein
MYKDITISFYMEDKKVKENKKNLEYKKIKKLDM